NSTRCARSCNDSESGGEADLAAGQIHHKDTLILHFETHQTQRTSIIMTRLIRHWSDSSLDCLSRGSRGSALENLELRGFSDFALPARAKRLQLHESENGLARRPEQNSRFLHAGQPAQGPGHRPRREVPLGCDAYPTERPSVAHGRARRGQGDVERPPSHRNRGARRRKRNSAFTG